MGACGVGASPGQATAASLPQASRRPCCSWLSPYLEEQEVGQLALGEQDDAQAPLVPGIAKENLPVERQILVVDPAGQGRAALVANLLRGPAAWHQHGARRSQLAKTLPQTLINKRKFTMKGFSRTSSTPASKSGW